MRGNGVTVKAGEMEYIKIIVPYKRRPDNRHSAGSEKAIRHGEIQIVRESP